MVVLPALALLAITAQQQGAAADGGTSDAGRLRQISVVFGPPMRFATGQKASRDDMAKWTDAIMNEIFRLRETLGGD